MPSQTKKKDLLKLIYLCPSKVAETTPSHAIVSVCFPVQLGVSFRVWVSNRVPFLRPFVAHTYPKCKKIASPWASAV